MLQSPFAAIPISMLTEMYLDVKYLFRRVYFTGNTAIKNDALKEEAGSTLTSPQAYIII